MSNFNLETKLPSLGRIYNPPISPNVTLRSMTARDEKAIFGSWTEKSLDTLLQSCVTEPKDLKVSELFSPDKIALLVNLRILTYGEEYEFTVKCQECGKKQKVKINMLEDYDYSELSEDMECQPIHMVLPVCKDELDVYFLTSKELTEVDNWTKRIMKNTKEASGDPSLLLRYAMMIKSINGKTDDSKEKRLMYLENLHAKDFQYISYKLSKIRFGFDFTVTKECQYCGESIEFYAGLGPEFFRASFDD